jgi:AcrR family transcriptional regulator
VAPRKAGALKQNDRSLREHLIATAEQMICELGTAGLTVRAIARQAGVADGVLYNHFRDKEELLANALLAHVRSVERGLPGLPVAGEGTIEANLAIHLSYGLALHKAILPAFAGLTGQPAVLGRFAELGEHDEHGEHWRDRLAVYLRTEQTLGRLAPDAETDAAAAMIVGICHETVLSGLLPHAQPAESPSAESVISAVLNGIGK